MLYLHIRAKPNIMKVMYIISKILTLAGLAQGKMICLLFCKIPRQQRRHKTTLCDIEQNTQRCGGWHILYLTVCEKGVGSSPSCVSF
mgnify:CR=1 FL=1